MPVYELRRRNLKRIYGIHGGATHIARLLGLKSPSYVSQMAGGHRQMSETWARNIEQALNLEHGWMDLEHPDNAEPTAAGPRPDTSAAADAVLSIASMLEDAGIEVPLTTFATIVELALEHGRNADGVDPAFVRKLISLVNTAK